MLDTTVLGRTSLEVTRTGFGGIPIQRLGMDDAVSVITRALDKGVKLIDTARAYTDSELKIGAAIAGRKDRPVLVSKTYSRDADGARRDIDLSVKNLGTGYIDVYLLHNINSVELLDQVTGRDGAFEGILNRQADGVIGFNGISSHKPDIIHAALKKDLFDVVELPLNFIEQESLTVFKEAYRRDVGTIVMKPLAGGVLKPASAALKFVLSQSVVHCVIPGMQTINEVEENLSVKGSLSRDEFEKLLVEADRWGKKFCRKCEYCLPECPQGINITMILLFHIYFRMYGMTEWARNRYGALPVKAEACKECGKCQEKCPYNLPIIEMLKEAHCDMN